MPALGGQLAGHDRRALAVAILEDLQQVASLQIVERRQAKVVEDEHVETGDGGMEQGRREGRCFGRPPSAALQSKQVIRLFGGGVSKAQNRAPLAIDRPPRVRRILKGKSP
jgi:hypothetical protein